MVDLYRNFKVNGIKHGSCHSSIDLLNVLQNSGQLTEHEMTVYKSL